MITPNKAISFKNSIIFKMTYLLDEDFDQVLLTDLYKITKRKFEGIDEFIYSINTLYVLGKIDLDLQTGKINKC